MAERIDVGVAHSHLGAGALLVCAYDDERWRQNKLEGAISLPDFRAKEKSLRKDREVIFYCACPNEATSAHVADGYTAQGFTSVKVLAGGVKAWKTAGYGVTAAP